MAATISRLEAGVSSDYIVNDGIMSIALIYVPAEHRRGGLGTRELKRLISIADERGWQIELMADGVFGVPVQSLVAWYMRHGFIVMGSYGSGARVRMIRYRAA